MKNIKIVYMASALLLAQSARVLSVGLDRAEVIAALRAGNYTVASDGASFIIVRDGRQIRLKISDFKEFQDIEQERWDEKMRQTPLEVRKTWGLQSGGGYYQFLTKEEREAEKQQGGE